MRISSTLVFCENKKEREREIERKKKKDRGEERFYILDGKKKYTFIYSSSSTLCFSYSVNQQ